MRTRHLAALLLVVAVLAACAPKPNTPQSTVIVTRSATSAAPTPTTAVPTTPAATDTPTRRDAAQADLDNAEVPAYCPGSGAGAKLSGGRWQGSAGQEASITDVKPVFTDLNGDGGLEAVAFLQCNAGGTTWPDAIVVVGAGGKILAANQPLESQGYTHGTGLTLTARGGSVGFVYTGSGAPGEATFRKVLTYSGGGYTSGNDPIDALKDATFTTDGFGPILVGMTREQVIATGYGTRKPGCPGAQSTPEAHQKGLSFLNGVDGVLSGVGTTSSGLRTRLGAHVGMTVAALKAIYGSDIEKKMGGVQSLGPVYVLAYQGQQLVFMLDRDESRVQMIFAALLTDGMITHGTDLCDG